MPKNMICTWVALLLLMAAGVSGADQNQLMLLGSEEEMEALYGDEEFVSIATGSSKPVYKAPAVASVITAKQIEAMGARTLDEVLERVPGLHVGVSTQGRLDSIYSIRGIHTSFNPQVLVLMNGLPFPFFSGGRPFQFRLPVAAIERIEVIRGPGSAIYGADAYAGVINILTKDKSDMDGTSAGADYGSFNSHDLWFQHGKSWGNWDIALSLEWQKTDGDKDRRLYAVSMPGPLDTRYNIFDTHLSIKRDNWKLRYWYWRQDDAGLGAGAAQVLDPQGGEDIGQHLADISYNTSELIKDWNLSANLNYMHRKNESRFVLFPAGTVLPIGSDGNLEFTSTNFVNFTDGLIGEPITAESSTGLDLVATYSGQLSHIWRLGAGIKYYKNEVTKELKNFGPGVIDGTQLFVDGTLTDVSNTPNVFTPDKSRTIYYLSLQDEWQFASDWELTGGVRYDHYSDFGSTINPRIALVWATRYNLTTKFLYGRAFRAPSFNELFSINNPVALGNPNLDPETIDTIEVAFDYRPTFDIQSAFSLFAYRAKDLIDFVPDSGSSTITAQNNRDQDGYGFELEVSWKATNQLDLYGNFSWQHSEDRATGHRIADAPGKQLFLNANWKFLPDWNLHPQFNWVAGRKRAATDTRAEIEDYATVDITLSRKNIAGHWDISITTMNIFDEDAMEPSNPVLAEDIKLAGRSFWAAATYRF